MLSRIALLMLAAFGAVTLMACTPSGDRVKDDIEEKSYCKLSNYRTHGEPKEDRQGYIHYEFTATVQCSNPRSFYNKKFSEPTPVDGEAEMLGKWLGLRHELSRYEFKPTD